MAPDGATPGQTRLLHDVVDYAAFFVLAALLVTGLHVRRRFDVVQVNTLPDLLVLAVAVPRATGARVLLDLQECMPEFYATKFRRGPGTRAFVSSRGQSSWRCASPTT